MHGAWLAFSPPLASLALLFAAAVSAGPAARARPRQAPRPLGAQAPPELKKNDAKRDRDRDGLSNLREYRAHTNPRKKDSDRDGLKDGRRVAASASTAGPRSTRDDSDNDGVKDGRENAGKVASLQLARSRSGWPPAAS